MFSPGDKIQLCAIPHKNVIKIAVNTQMPYLQTTPLMLNNDVTFYCWLMAHAHVTSL